VEVAVEVAKEMLQGPVKEPLLPLKLLLPIEALLLLHHLFNYKLLLVNKLKA
jgi:hypothetical protein